MDFQILKYFGLHKNDIEIYKALLGIGLSKTGQIMRTTSISSSRVYESLKHLIQKGLVSYQVRNNIKYYQAEMPDQLIEIAETNKLQLQKFATEVRHFPIRETERNETNVYEGKHGFKMAFTEHIRRLQKKEEISIIAFSTRFANSKELRVFLANLDRILLNKKCRIRMLLEKEMESVMKKDRVDMSLYSIRYLPSGYFSPTAVNISEHEVMLSVWGKTPIVFSIKNPPVIAGFKKNFEFLWNMAK